MCQYSAEDGFANQWHLVHYGSRAVGGAGLIIQEAAAVSPEGRITPGDLGLYSDDHIERLKEITGFIRQQGAVPGVQLAHAGRKASCDIPLNGGRQLSLENSGWQTVAPSPLAFTSGERVPAGLTQEGIRKVISDFREAAVRALQAGYKLAEVHAAHGYLIHQFLSPLSNQRSDQYGGSFENRIRLLLEVVDSIRMVWPEELPLIVRISATDYMEGGWNVDEAVKLAAILKQHGVDLIDCSSGGLIPHARIPFGPGYQVAFAGRIRKEAGIPVAAVGLITEPAQAEAILQNDQADLILLGREFLRNPHFPLYAASVLGEETDWPVQYLRARPSR
jgi:2,4-dienoyl-CoA reductase-like NADH-dependent reductase (Old Yellow Enzyme family)